MRYRFVTFVTSSLQTAQPARRLAYRRGPAGFVSSEASLDRLPMSAFVALCGTILW